MDANLTNLAKGEKQKQHVRYLKKWVCYHSTNLNQLSG